MARGGLKGERRQAYRKGGREACFQPLLIREAHLGIFILFVYRLLRMLTREDEQLRGNK